jgi:hypothetical protein
LAVTALWVTLPLHVSASLMAVQRMTTLSTTFMLLGLIGYVVGRAQIHQSPKRAYWLMNVSVVVGTVLAVLCKEIGALLPLYMGVIEVTLIRAAGVPAPLPFRRWAWFFLGLPILLLVAYFVTSWPRTMAIYAFRDFSLSERLLTESRILWEYLGQIFLPARSGTGPYQDDYLISKGLFAPVETAVAMLAWAATVFCAWRLRQKFPVILFALLWFLVGHLIESTIIPLELYFEHRNYLPSVGPLLAACVLLWQVPTKVLRLTLAGLTMMLLLRMFVLSETTLLWGQPLVAAKVWVEEHPQSARAAQYLSRQYFDAGDGEAARNATLDGHERIRDDIGLALQSVYLNCMADEETAFLSRVKAIEPVLTAGTGGMVAPELLTKMMTAQQKGACPHLTLGQLIDEVNALLANPHNQASPGLMGALHLFKYRVYALQGKLNLSVRELYIAFDQKKELVFAIAAARVVADAGYYDEALAFVDQTMSFAPWNPILKLHWKTELGKLKSSIEQQRTARRARAVVP